MRAGSERFIRCPGCQKVHHSADFRQPFDMKPSPGEPPGGTEFNICFRCRYALSIKLRKAERLAAKWSDEAVALRREKATARSKRRKDIEKQATPKWQCRAELKKIYEEAKVRTKTTKVVHHVDHIIPLKHKAVCGLHVAANLRVVPAVENMSKGNKCDADEFLYLYA